MALVMVMPLQASNATYVTPKKDFISFFHCFAFAQKKHMRHHQQGAMVASCGGASVRGMQAKSYKLTSVMTALIANATINLWCLCCLLASVACMQRAIILKNQTV